MRAPTKRWALAFLMSAGICVNYIDRVNISHAIVFISREMSLTPLQQGLILSSFSWGYVAFMLVGGFLVDRVGGLRTAALASGLWSLATVWSGLAMSPTSLLWSRVVIGAGEAPIFPANARIVREQFPLNERGRATAVFDAGAYLGTALSAPLVVFIMMRAGWRWSFLACAALGLCWTGAWLWLAPRLQVGSEKHPQQGRASILSLRHYTVLLCDRRVAGAAVGFFCYNYVKSFFLTWFPTYLMRERGFDLLTIGWVGIIPPLSAIAGEILAGWATDDMLRRGISIEKARKIPLTLGLMLSGTIALTLIISQGWAVIAVMSVSFAATVAASPSIWAIPGDLAPRPDLVGMLGAVQNMVSNVAGIVAPIMTGFLLSKSHGFSIAIILSSIIGIVGAVIYWVVVSPLTPLRTQQNSVVEAT